jgi:hypothetical protein
MYAEAGGDWRNRFTFTDADTNELVGEGTDLGMRVCAPGWNDSATYAVVFNTETTTRAIIRVETTLFGDDGQPVRTLEAERTCTIVQF